MNTPSRPARRIRIDRLELDLRGIAAGNRGCGGTCTGPALADALASQKVRPVGPTASMRKHRQPASPDVMCKTTCPAAYPPNSVFPDDYDARTLLPRALLTLY